MLGLNRPTTYYTIRATHYSYLGSKGNVQNWEQVGHIFKCNYSTTLQVDRYSSSQGIPKPSLAIETTSNLDFKIEDKILINGQTYLVKDISTSVEYMSAKYTNKPLNYIKTLTLE